MLAAAGGVPYTIPYGGAAQLQLAQDVARAFIAASLSGTDDATVHNVPGPRVTVAEVIEAIGDAVPGARIGFEDTRLPFPEEIDSASFAELVPGFVTTPLSEGVSSTVARFRGLLADGRISPPS
jgi:nucleoside-diphosphate-sugar epimerase